ncbi:MAG: phosphoesterase [Acidobacteriota bacterium]|nr:phosphoesterase [Acidobacteriota bacterium]
MSFKSFVAGSKRLARLALVTLAVSQFSMGAPLAGARDQGDSRPARTPIKHVIIIIGENRTFDHLFATYVPERHQRIWNLLSEGIVNPDGRPGPHYKLAQQNSATDTTTFSISPTITGVLSPLPAPLNGGPKDPCASNGMCTLADSLSSEYALSQAPIDYNEFLLTGGTGLGGKVPDSRITGVSGTAPYSTLMPGPFQLTNGSTLVDDSYAASPVHRFYQMWQQEDCSASNATPSNPSGCRADLFPWVEVTEGAGSNGVAQPANFSTDYAPGKKTTGEGSTSMGFYNMLEGDAAYTKSLADTYAISDNYHQAGMGGTGINHILLGFGDDIWFSDENGNALAPPHNVTTPFGGPLDEVENPNPEARTNNWYSQDGYGGYGDATTLTGTSTSFYGGGSYSECSDTSQPGVGPVVSYLKSIGIKPNCDPGHYYIVNNYNPGYFGDGSDAFTDYNSNNIPYTVPGTTQRSIADVLLAAGVSWATYFDQWNNYLTDKYQLNYGTVGPLSDAYCNICNPFQYETQIMTNDAIRTSHMFDVSHLYTDIQNGTLPAVSFVKPSGWVDGHPASSKWDLYEGFVRKIVQEVQSKPDLWRSTAIFITTDEGGGYYDSGYIQPLDFFGDGTRIPMVVVSPWAKPGYVSHEYTDHVSLLKFIERNWDLPTVSNRSRDNMPNPVTAAGNPYVPLNRPAIGDLFDLFSFPPPPVAHDRDRDDHGGH